MINRELIRSKVLQICYSFVQNETRDMKGVEQELILSLSKAHEMYMMLLFLLTEIGRFSERMYDVQIKRAERLGDDNFISDKFVKNRFLQQLTENAQLKAYQESFNGDVLDAELVQALWKNIEESDYFQAYLGKERRSYEDDREIVRTIYKNEICNNEQIDNLLEDAGIYWNDDKPVVDSFVLKTINRFKEDSTEEQPLFPAYRNEDDKLFAVTLLKNTLENAAHYDELIAECSKNWALERIALMDRIILQIALAEITCFANIPINVSINEYVELAKQYSTPNSASFVNGTLDHIVKALQKQKKLIKEN